MYDEIEYIEYDDFELSDEDELFIQREMKRDIIKDRFESLMFNAQCILDTNNPIKSMIVTGAAGIGKTYNLEKFFEDNQKKGLCKLLKVNGNCTKVGLYKALWEARHLGTILILDDVNVFDDESMLDILKAALDTSEKRIITYKTGSNSLLKEGIDTQFIFDGAVIFITNNDLARQYKAGGKLSSHIGALMSRTPFIDLGIHTNEEIMIHIETLLNTTPIISSLGISKPQSNDIYNFMLEHQDRLIKPSLRMPILMSGLLKADPINWKQHALNTFTVGEYK